MGKIGLGRLALLTVIGAALSMASFSNVEADDGTSPGYTAFDISWPQCPNDIPDERFEFAIIGLNNGRPFTQNPCFMTQYTWARAAEPHPDVYINTDFPKPGRQEALSGPWGRCEELDHWCRGYNWGYNAAADAVRRAMFWDVTPGRFWLDVETDNYWISDARSNSQVVRGAIDYFVEHNIPVGIYSTYYQWGLITGNYMPPVQLPIWVAGATNQFMAADRCTQERFKFAGGETWLVQYVVGRYDHNHACPPKRASEWLEQLAAEKAAEPPEPAPGEARLVDPTPAQDLVPPLAGERESLVAAETPEPAPEVLAVPQEPPALIQGISRVVSMMRAAIFRSR